MNDILIIPSQSKIEFSGSDASKIYLGVDISGSIDYIGTTGSIFKISDNYPYDPISAELTNNLYISSDDYPSIILHHTPSDYPFEFKALDNRLGIFNDELEIIEFDQYGGVIIGNGYYSSSLTEGNLIVQNHIGIGTDDLTYALNINGSISASGYIFAPNIGTGEDNSVVILDSDGRLKTDEIDSRVWGSSLLDSTNGVNNRIATFTDSNSLNGEANLTFDGTSFDVTGNITGSNIRSDGNIYGANIGADTDNSVVILNSSGYLKTDEIDSRVWGSSLVDGGGSSGHVAFWTDANTLSYDNGQLYWDSGNNRLGIGTTTPTQPLTVEGIISGSNIYTKGNIVQTEDDTSIYNNFVSGIFGTGFQLKELAGESNLEIDNITVRNSLRTHIFQKDVVKATNGYLYVSDAIVIDEATATTVKTRDDKSAVFVGADLPVTMTLKDVNSSTGIITDVEFTLDSIASSGGSGDTEYTIYNVTYNTGAYTDVQDGMTAVRTSGGSILLDASSTYSPFIAIYDDDLTEYTRMGKLDGITSDQFGALSGYGFWASGSAYLEGTINATSGIIGGWAIGSDLTGGNIVLSPSSHIAIGATDFETGNGIWLGNDGKASFGNDAGSRLTWDLTNVRIYNNSNDELVTLGTTNQIAGWQITSTEIHDAGSKVYVDAGNSRFLVKDGSGNERVRMGLLNATQYGISGSDENGNLLFKLGEAGNEIANWVINSGQLYNTGSAGGVIIDASNKLISIMTGSVGDEAILEYGQLETNSYGIRGYDTAELGHNLLFKLGMEGNEIAGWEISGSRIHKYDNTANGGLVMNASNLSYDVYTGSNSANIIVQMGQIATEKFGIRGNDTEGNLLFKLGMDGNEIAGWTIDETYIGKDAVRIDADNVKFIAGNSGLDTGTGNIRAAFGKYDGTNYGLRVWDGTDTYVKLSSDGNNEIAGWILNPTEISKNNLKIRSSDEKIVVGTEGINSHVVLGKYDGTNYGISGSDGSGNTIFELGGTNQIAGWTIASTKLSKNNINLDSGNSKIYIGAGTYNNSNTAFYADNDGKFSLKDKLTFDGTDLTVVGDITANSGYFNGDIDAVNINADSGSIANFIIETNSIHDVSNNLILKSDGRITGSYAQLLGGEIGGWDLSTTGLAGGNTTLHSSGYINLGTSNDIVKLSSVDPTYRLWVGHATAGSAPFRVTKAGALTATNATIDGTINASAGIFTGNVSAGNVVFGVDADGAGSNGLYINYYNYFLDVEGFPNFSVGKENQYFKFDSSNISFEGTNASLTTGGLFTATNAKIVGNITASQALLYGDITASGAYFSSSYIEYISGSNLYFENAFISGSIYADTGYIGGSSGWTIGENGITGNRGVIKTEDSTTQRIVIDGGTNNIILYDNTNNDVAVFGYETISSSANYGLTLDEGVINVETTNKEFSIKAKNKINSSTIENEFVSINGNFEAWMGNAVSGSDYIPIKGRGDYSCYGGQEVESNIYGVYAEINGTTGLPAPEEPAGLIPIGTAKIAALYANVSPSVIYGYIQGTATDNYWAGYFDNGSVKIKDNLYISGSTYHSSSIIISTGSLYLNAGNIEVTGNISSSNLLLTDVYPKLILNDLIIKRSAGGFIVSENYFSASLFKSEGQFLFKEGTTTANGIIWGTDTNLYRSSSNMLKTDDSFYVGGDVINLNVLGAGTLNTEVNYATFRGGSSTQPRLEIGGNNTTDSATRYSFLQAEDYNGTEIYLCLNPNGGNVAINKAKPSVALEVAGMVSGSNISTNGYVYGASQLVSAGDVVGYGSNPSDLRLKENISYLTSSIDIIDKLNPISFEWKNRKDGKHFGLIAQETEKIIPEIVIEKQIPQIFGDEEVYKLIRYAELIPHLIGSIKELNEKIKYLEDKLKEK